MTEFGLAIRNFVGPGEVPDVPALYAYAERAEALGFESLWAWDHVLLGVEPAFPILDSITMLGRGGRPHPADQARYRRAGAAPAQPGGRGQGPGQPRRDLGRAARPGRRRRLVRARVRRGRGAVQAARPPVRTEPRHPPPPLGRGARHPARRRVQPARGGDGPPAGPAASAAGADRGLRRRRAPAGGHARRRLAHLLLHARELQPRAGRR